MPFFGDRSSTPLNGYLQFNYNQLLISQLIYSTFVQKNRKRVKREKREKGLQSPPGTAHHPKTEVDVVAAAEAVETVSGTAERRIVVPRTAPQSFICLILLFFALF
jgi:hypothetical protein